MSTAAEVKLLLVDDLQENLTALQALVRGEDRQVFCARSGEDALVLMLEHEFALALVDVQMPGMSGFELAETMRSTERTRRIPIIFVSAAGREMNYAFRGYESGAVDFLHKPLDPHTVRSKVNVFIDLYRQRLALEAAQRELQRAVRMRDDFMSMVSHELRTPLNTLHLQTQLRTKLLASEQPLDAAVLRKMAERDDRQIRSMVRLIDDMLDVSRLRTGRLAIKPAETDLAGLVRHVAEDFTEQAKAAGCDIGVHTPESLPIECDPFRIEQVVTNLISNALRYGAGSPVEVRLVAEADGARLSVRDGGIGIAPADQDRIFQQFERTEDARSKASGLGLGLYITRQIVIAHGGSISVTSGPGQGSEFAVRLPSRAAADPAA